MFGIIGTLGVITQMALLSTGYDPKTAMMIGLASCAAWVGHAFIKRDRALMVTNIVVAGFATWGIV